ncbi:GNAT family N-acetyltransferase [Parachitinimonas caeni]|uniref:GNAT family N-acetyltransferase n=1 Tax=Parachitinimonas caeni TaxID=3031301 RepID=A0ABT7DWY0_9NEIS|nr:GNAT family N-acetyltransferase [Parachitinimonas caeni]MDK2124577.1 GNAT family N-acetyltransferase [Parachitinimonas caeni]
MVWQVRGNIVCLTYELQTTAAADAEQIYQIVKATMYEMAVAVHGSWNEGGARRHTEEHARSGEYQLIRCGREIAGAMLLKRHADHFQLESLYILPPWQKQQIGSRILADIQAEARACQLPVRLRVLSNNPAREFYRHYGFVVVDSTPERFFMEYRPESGLNQ